MWSDPEPVDITVTLYKVQKKTLHVLMPGCYLQLCQLLKSVNHCDIKYVSVKISGMSFSSAEVPAGYSNKNRNDKKR